MKTGIIILFNNFIEEMDLSILVKNIKKIKSVEFCLVNNNCDNETMEGLIELSEHCKNVSIINIRKFRTETSAIRAGVRYLWNQFGIEQICYIILNQSKLASREFSLLIKEINNKEEFIKNYKRNIYVEGQTKKTLFQNVFSLREYLKDYHEYYNDLRA